MPRRKNAYLSDGSDSDASVSGGSASEYDSQEDQDSRAERRLFEHKGAKRRKTGRSGKEDNWEGIFGEEEEESRGGRGDIGGRGGGRGRGRGGSSRTDWTKAPAFVSTTTTETPAGENDLDDAGDEDAANGSSDDDDNDGSSSNGSSDSHGETRPPSPRVREEEDEEDDQPRRGMGLGFQRAAAPAAAAEQIEPPKIGGRGGIGSSSRGGKAGIGSSSREPVASSSTSGYDTPEGGLGSSSAPTNPIDDDDAPRHPSMPAAFGRPPPSLTASSGTHHAQRSFKARAPSPSTTAAAPLDLTAHERAHFSKIQGSWAAQLLAKQGWQAGKGLGAQEDGRAVPIEVGKVFRGQGIQSGMRTEDSKREARRQAIREGRPVSDESEDEQPKKKGHKGKGPKAPKEKKEPQEQGWKKQKKVKVKVEHKTYEQLLAEAGDAAAGTGVGLVLDARGGELKEVQSLSSLSLSTWTPTSDAARLPELRHNLRLILDVAKGDVDALAREGKAVNERRRWALREEQISRAKVEETEKRASRLRQIQSLVETISTLATEQAASPTPSLAPLAESFNSLVNDYSDEYKLLGLDDVVVGAIGQILRDAFAEWQPFDVSADILLSSLKTWRKAYNLPKSDEDDALALAVNGEGIEGQKQKQQNGDRVMTAWESLLWSLWLPKVRSSINNDWDPSRPNAAVHLLESWEPILPPFIRDNVLDQLVLPKVKTAVEQWDPKKAKLSGTAEKSSLASIVFPWLPLLAGRVEEVMELAKRRIRSVLHRWVPKDGVPEELIRWKKDVYSSSEWDKLMLQFVLTKLGTCLRDDFSVNPRKQDMVPLEEWVMPWHKLLRASMFAQLLEAEFFPKWLDILYIWLVQPAYKPNEVAAWFTWWKERFPQAVLDIRGIAHGFESGIRLMEEAVNLGPEAPSKLQKPVFQPLPPKSSSSKSSKSSRSGTSAPKPGPGAAPPGEITFRALAEEYATQNDLIFLPLGRSHATTGKPLFKVSKGVDGRGGVTVYVGDNAVFALGEGGEWRAVSLEDMVKRAQA
ncbi:hypothetical protein IAT38_003649 [Cryptococcus sp. DSM 104549]